MKYDDKNIKASLKKILDAKRYEHTIGVADTAANLAYCYGIDFEKAYIAGLLHDCAKCYDNDKKLKLCKKYKVSLSDFEKENPSLIHAVLGAKLASVKYGIEDNELISAIRFHTTGKPDMSMLEMIVFCADFIEPNRKPLDCLPHIRELIYKDIYAATYEILDQTLHHLKKYEQGIDPHTLDALTYYAKYQIGKVK